MRRLVTAVGAGVVLVLAGACAGARNDQGQPGQLQPGGGPPVVTTSPAPPSAPGTSEPPADQGEPPAGAQLVPAEKIEKSSLPEGYPVQVWTTGDGRTVGLTGQEGGCGKAGVEVAEQSPQQVVLLTYESVPAQPRMCTMDIRYPTLSATLDNPLGDRKVVMRHENRKY